jgi:anti-anti-sigma factor
MWKENLKITEYERHVVVRAHGSLETDAAERVRAIMISCLNKGDTQLVLDMQGVPYINSDGLRMLQDVQRRAETQAASLSLANANDNVLRTLNMTQLDKQLPVYTSVEEALNNHKQ